MLGGTIIAGYQKNKVTGAGQHINCFSSISKSSLNIAKQVLVRGGNAILKVFEGELLKEFKKETEECFDKVLLTKPMASRQQSSELYMMCRGFRSNDKA